jgi:hypothetical protein
MHREDENLITSLIVLIEEKHPRPRPQHKSGGRPSPIQLRARKWKGFKNPQQADDPAPGVSGQAEPRDGLIHVPLGSRADDYLGHSGQLVERNAFSAPRLRETLLSALPGARNPIKDLRDAAGVRIDIV